MNLSFPILMVTAVLLTGCASKYSCGAPAGQSCRSISEIYELREQGALPHQQGKTASSQAASRSASSNQDLWWQDDTVYPETPAATVIQPLAMPGITSVEPGDPLLSRPRVLRVWIGPWEDRDDLHDEQFVYLRLDRGNWLLTGDAGQESR